MAKKKIKGRNVTKTTEAKGAKIVVHELNVTSADRSYKDVGELKEALQSAERIHYPNRTQLYDLYDDVVLDGQVTASMGKLVDEVLNKKICFKKNKKEVEEMDEVIESTNFRKVVKEIVMSECWGISGMEFIPGAEILKFESFPRKHIKTKEKVISTHQSSYEGTGYEGVQNFWIVGDDKNLGLLLKASLYATYKRGTLGDWAQYIEIFGQPVRVIYYDVYDEQTKKEVKQVLDESGGALAMMIPKQAQFDMKDGKQSNGDGNLQFKFLSYLDDQISMIFLGNTETTQASSSSGHAQSKEHSKQQLIGVKSLIKLVQNYLNSEHFLRICQMYGLPVEGGKFVFEKEIDLAELKAKAEVEEIVIRTYKVPTDDDYVYETYGIRKPAN
ncbi:MAG: DUF935 family protein, partial [Cyclobacteriaceae bacterium]|nr:DUF935 family protein [Cyclobacteriaceae bacterium]